MANKITYTDKVGIEPQTVHINQWWDDDANEIKSKHNLNDDRITVLEAVDPPFIYKSNLAVSVDFQFTVPDGYIVGTMSVMYISGTITKVYLGSSVDATDLVFGLIPASGDTVPRIADVTAEVAYGGAAQIYIGITGTSPVVNVYIVLKKIR